MRPGASILAAVVALALLPSNAAAAGRWMVTGRTTLPSDYWQGVAFDGAGAAWFAGPSVGLYRTSPRLAEEARVASALSPGEPFNHIGDLEWDGREGGRLLLPLECYNPFASPTNTCGIGAVGVADPIGLGRRYTVQLAGVPKAMWLALAPDGVVWTQAGTDLLGFSADAITAGAGPLQPVRRLAAALPEQVTGAAVLDGLLYTAVQAGPSLLRLYAVDLATG